MLKVLSKPLKCHIVVTIDYTWLNWQYNRLKGFLISPRFTIEAFYPIYGYLVSNKARVYSTKTNKIIKSFTDKEGYVQIRVGKYRSVRLHRMVAITQIPNPEGKPEVNHKDGVKGNNLPSNLEWMTGAENIEHAIRMGLIGKRRGSAKIYKIEKKCRYCEELKKATEFYEGNECRKCYNLRMKKYYQENKEKYREKYQKKLENEKISEDI